MTRAGRGLLALVVGGGLALTACSAPAAEPRATPAPDGWAEIDAALAALAPDVGFLAAAIAPDGTCEPVHAIEPSAPRPMASQFKLFVLGALADRIAAGSVSWDRALTVDEATKSVGNGPGSLQLTEAGTAVSVEEAATKMISISDNTATDMLVGLLGRDAVEAWAEGWMADASANEPFLTTREMVLLHYAEGLGDRYLATPQRERDAFLASSVDPLPLSAIGSAYTTEPRFVDTIEWFGSPEDLCRAFAGLHAQAQDPALSPLPAVLSQEDVGIDLPRRAWPTVWYKGGSEPGVLTMGWLATDADGETFVVEAMVSDPDTALAADSLTDLVAIGRDAFALLA